MRARKLEGSPALWQCLDHMTIFLFRGYKAWTTSERKTYLHYDDASGDSEGVVDEEMSMWLKEDLFEDVEKCRWWRNTQWLYSSISKVKVFFPKGFDLYIDVFCLHVLIGNFIPLFSSLARMFAFIHFAICIACRAKNSCLLTRIANGFSLEDIIYLWFALKKCTISVYLWQMTLNSLLHALYAIEENKRYKTKLVKKNLQQPIFE